jgi:iron complex outermembrane receptor protein
VTFLFQLYTMSLRTRTAHAARPHALAPIAQASLLMVVSLAGWAHAQTASTDNASGLDTRIVAPKAQEPRASISGLGDVPVWKAPVQANRYSAEALQQAQVKRLADLSTLDASVTDGYNAGGYWDSIAVRGFTLDDTQNYMREGLPISAQTSLNLSNKSGVEVFKGTSGMQAGISAPGGLLNLLVKRPTETVRHAQWSWTSRNSQLAAVDLSERFGAEQSTGLRLNASVESLRPNVHPLDGSRHLVALATDWRASRDTLVEFELEHSRTQQNSAPGYSLLGNTLPSANRMDPDRSLNNQPWTRPVGMEGATGTVRLTQALPESWKLVAIYGEQHLRSDDRAAFPFGCSADNSYTRFCSDGSYDIYDYESENESRITRALDVKVSGSAQALGMKHDLAVGLARSTQRIDVANAIYDFKGTVTANSTLDTTYAYAYSQPQNLRRQRSTALSLRDAIQLNADWTAWLGARTTQLDRRQSLSDGSVAESQVKDTMTTPWAALGYQLQPGQQVYASWGEGVESLMAPFGDPLSRPSYLNYGAYLPAAKSRQLEAGFKSQGQGLFWSVNAFRIVRPKAEYVATNSGMLQYQRDGEAVHQGMEAQTQTHIERWELAASAMLLDAKRRGSATDALNGKAPTNVPRHTLKLSGTYNVGGPSNIKLGANLVNEGSRTVDVVEGISLPSWTRIDASASCQTTLDGSRSIQWSLGIANVLDTRAWRESPTQFGHIYLLPMASRTATLTAQLDF